MAVLQMDPDHIGANHYMVHVLESQGQAGNAIPFSEKLAANADFNAHAVHMHGHILPSVGQWDEAVEYFEMAHQIHVEWAEKNEAEAGRTGTTLTTFIWE